MNEGWGRVRPKFGDLPFSWDGPADGDRAGPNDGELREGLALAMETPAERRVALPREYVLPGYEGVPCGELNQVMRNMGHTGDINRYYTLWSNGSERQKKFTCVFTSPLTGEHFACGLWTNNKGGVIHEESTYWYNKKSAKHAAAAKCLDCMALRRCHGTEKWFIPRCEDLPYLVGNAPLLPKLPKNVKLPIIMQGDGVTVKQDLVNWYLSFWRKMNTLWPVPSDVEPITPECSCYTSWSNMRDSVNRRFTATYVCPLTGEKYLSGTLNHVGDQTIDHMFYDPVRHLLLSNLRSPAAVQGKAEGEDCAESHPLFKIDLVWYSSKKRAENAAAARALDCLRHRASAYGMDGASGGLCCAEEPYLRGEAPGGWRDISEAAKAAEEMIYDGATPLEPYYVPFAVVPESERITTKFHVSDFHSLVETSHDNEEWRKRHQDARRNETSRVPSHI